VDERSWFISNEISKRELFSRQALGAGLGVGALALMAQTRPASADSPFTSFAFSATGGVTPRTMPDRLSDVKNVKDFGATGDGATDDTAAIQACINWAGSTATNRGVIFFPEGNYRISDTLVYDPVGEPHSIIFRGVGKASRLLANMNKFILRNPGVVALTNLSIDVIEGLWFVNSNSGTSSGCIDWNSTMNIEVRNCNLDGYRGYQCLDNINLSIHNCEFTQAAGGTPAGSFGIGFQGGNHAEIFACDFVGFEDGVRVAGAAYIHGCRFEVNQNGINIGSDISAGSGGTYASGGCMVSACAFECNDTAIFARSMYHSTVQACGILAHAASPWSPADWPRYGIRHNDGYMNIYASIFCQGSFDTESFLINDGTQSNTFIGVRLENDGLSPSTSTTKWQINGSNTNGLTFIRCTPDVVPMLPVTTFASLPSSPNMGMTYSITDGDATATFGHVETGGGTAKKLLYYNGTNWTVCGV
jgi:hypothetical protein